VSTNTHAHKRLEFLDAHRGLAVLLMLWMHTADGWLLPGLKSGGTWNFIRGLGGLAAPSFLLLAGLSLGLGWGTRAGSGNPRSEIARGLSLVVLGYALRLQMWMLDAGGYERSEAWAGALPLACGYLAAYRGLLAFEQRKSARARGLGMVALALIATGFAIVAKWVPDRLTPLLRVDVLQAIGGSLVIVSWLGEPLRRRPGLGVVLAVAVGLATQWLRGWVPGPLPVPLAGYLAQWDVPRGTPVPSLFPLFPWMAYALLGAGLGIRLGRLGPQGAADATRLWLRWTIVGAAVAVICCEPLPIARALLAAQPWLLQLIRVGYRAGCVMVLGALAVALSRPAMPLRNGLFTLGRASLFVYWVHLEFAFGTVAKPIIHKLPFELWALGLCLLAVLMTFAAEGWLRLRSALRARTDRTPPRPNASPELRSGAVGDAP
jgi:uncharacterized membrane protein